MVADAAGEKITEVVDEPPLERKQAVQQPDVEVLVPVVCVARLPVREPQERSAALEIGIERGNVRIGVVQHVVLVPPHVRARADQVERERQDRVRAGARGGPSVVGVVHYGKADAGHGKTGGDGQEGRFPGPDVREHQHSVRRGKPGENGGALQAHRPTAMARARRTLEVALDAAVQVLVKRTSCREPGAPQAIQRARPGPIA